MDVNPIALHGEATQIQPNPRPITIEDNVLNQIDRIGYLRSIGEDWKEPVFHLRDIIVGLEDEEFFDGIPMNFRKKELTLEERNYYVQRGWDSIKVRSKEGPDGEYLDPTPGELSRMLRILMALLARRNMTWKRRMIDTIPMNVEESESLA